MRYNNTQKIVKYALEKGFYIVEHEKRNKIYSYCLV